MTRMKGRTRRRGSGMLLVIILALLFIVTMVAIFRLAFSGQVTDQVVKLSLGRQALNLASSGVEEAMLEFQELANQPGSPVFEKLRDEVYTGSTGEIDEDFFRPLIKTDASKALLAKQPFDRFEMEVSVRIAFQNQFSRLPYERQGVVLYKAVAWTKLSLTEKVQRSVERAQAFKTALISVPRPFDQTLVYVQQPGPLVERANPAIEGTRSELDDRRRERDEIVTRLQNESFTGVDQIRPLWENFPLPTEQEIKKDVHLFDEPLVLYVVADSFDLGKMDLPSKLDDLNGKVQRAQDAYQRTKQRLDGNFSSALSHQNCLEALRDLMLAHRDRLQAIKQFQDDFAEAGGAMYGKLAKFAYKVDPKNIDEWRRKAFFEINELDGNGLTPRQHVERLFESYKKPSSSSWEPVNGVLYVHNPNTTLDLSNMDLPGRLVIVTAGKVRLNNTNTRWFGADDDNLLTLVSFADMMVEGKVRASLIPMRRISLDSSTQVNGSIVFSEVLNPSQLRGIVSYNPKIHSGRTTPTSTQGAFRSYYYVAVSPKIAYENVSRQ